MAKTYLIKFLLFALGSFILFNVLISLYRGYQLRQYLNDAEAICSQIKPSNLKNEALQIIKTTYAQKKFTSEMMRLW
jgi:hypothetical protein